MYSGRPLGVVHTGPTWKQFEVALIAILCFPGRNCVMTIYRGKASVLVQCGLLDITSIPGSNGRSQLLVVGTAGVRIAMGESSVHDHGFVSAWWFRKVVTLNLRSCTSQYRL